jgi:hypothetical protein
LGEDLVYAGKMDQRLDRASTDKLRNPLKPLIQGTDEVGKAIFNIQISTKNAK